MLYLTVSLGLDARKKKQSDSIRYTWHFSLNLTQEWGFNLILTSIRDTISLNLTLERENIMISVALRDNNMCKPKIVLLHKFKWVRRSSKKQEKQRILEYKNSYYHTLEMRCKCLHWNIEHCTEFEVEILNIEHWTEHEGKILEVVDIIFWNKDGWKWTYNQHFHLQKFITWNHQKWHEIHITHEQ